MIQINLLPNIKKELLRAQRQRNFVVSICIFASIAAGGVVLILAGVMGGQAIQKALLTGNIKSSAEEIKKLQTTDQLDEYLTVQNQLSQIGSLKSDQNVYSRFMDYLEELNPAAPDNVLLSTVEVTSESGSEGSSGDTISIKLSGSTASYRSLGVFEMTLSLAQLSFSASEGGDVETENLFTKVQTDSSALSTSDGVSFSITVECNGAAFAYDSSDIKLSVPTTKTSDSDRSAPKNVFDNSATSTTDSRGAN